MSTQGVPVGSEVWFGPSLIMESNDLPNLKVRTGLD